MASVSMAGIVVTARAEQLPPEVMQEVSIQTMNTERTIRVEGAIPHFRSPVENFLV